MASHRAPFALLVALCVAALFSAVCSEPLHLRFEREKTPNPKRLARRDDDTVETPLYNVDYYLVYLVNISIGEPAQTVSLQLDTGSSDLWVFGPGSCDPKKVSLHACLGGTYEPDDSKTADLMSKKGFSITYGTPGSFVKGDLYTDHVTIGDVTVKDQIFAVGRSTAAERQGILGIGFEENEAAYARGGKKYPNLISNLVSQGAINSKAYSLWLDSPDADAGSVLFGAYDTEKYEGDLIALPIIPDSETGDYRSLSVAWTYISLVDENGDDVGSEDGVDLAITLDSGSSWMTAPERYYNAILDFLGAVYDETYGYVVLCDGLRDSEASIVFGFGGPDGPNIALPVGNFASDLYDDSGNNHITDLDGNDICQAAISIGEEGDELVFGDTFLRAAYAVYDLENKFIYLAQANYNSKKSNVVPIGEDADVATVTASKSAALTATGLPDEAHTEHASVASVYTLGDKTFIATGDAISVSTTTSALSSTSTKDSAAAGRGTPSSLMFLAGVAAAVGFVAM
ncbi:yapsin [Fusarium albosuccineum]|uniref:Yapsin n=1 Tax=Fusarium albosuccineum TaxID=1237068 RepID=A0A8H4PDW0_9HYPO|nr:yapsin [Fusarium albosuccineum]